MNNVQFAQHVDDLVREQHGSVAPTDAARMLARAVRGEATGVYDNFLAPPHRRAVLAKGLQRLRRLDGPRGAVNEALDVVNEYRCRRPLTVAADCARRLAMFEPVFDVLYERNKV